MHRSSIPQKCIDAYDLEESFDADDYIFVEIRCGMYGLKQAGKVAHNQLKIFLDPHGYSPTFSTPGLWTHNTRKISFTLIFDDFGIKYENKSDAKHLMKILEDNYESIT